MCAPAKTNHSVALDLLHNLPSDYVNLAGLEGCGSFTDEGSKDDHSSPVGTEGHDKLESFGFWGRKFCIKNVEILSFGKIAEFAKFAGGKRRKSPDLVNLYERSELLGRGSIESLRALRADADKDINLSVSVRWGLDGRLLWLS